MTTSTSTKHKSQSSIESKISSAKQVAAYAAVDDYIGSDQIIGIGSGSTIEYAVERIGSKYRSHLISNIKCIPTSFQAQQLILDHQLPLSDLNQNFEIDVDIDGADEVDASLNCIKGGGGCHLQEKMVAYNAKKFVVIADYRKQSLQLNTSYTKGIPVSFLPQSRSYLKAKIENIGQNLPVFENVNVSCILRTAVRKAGPVITDEGHMIYDLKFDQSLNIAQVEQIDRYLHLIPGVIETGLFVNMCECAYFGQTDGTVIKVNKKDVLQTKQISIPTNNQNQNENNKENEIENNNNENEQTTGNDNNHIYNYNNSKNSEQKSEK